MIMVFKLGNKANPLGRPKRPKTGAEKLEAFYTRNQRIIEKVGDLALKHAVKHQEPWAIRLCMEYFYPKGGAYSTITKEENTEVNLNINQTLSLEDQRTFLQLWMKSKRGLPAFQSSGGDKYRDDEGEGQKGGEEV